jgi:hypothetical protein
LKKGITLIAVLVGVLAVTSGAFAANHYLITSSSQIKNGAISASDLSSAARKALQGQKGSTGAAGPQGHAGAQGPKGDTGAAGTPGKDGAPGNDGAPGKDGADAPAPEYGVGAVWVTRSASPSAWAKYSTRLGSPVGDTTGGVFRFTCSTAQAPCQVALQAAVLSDTPAGGYKVYPRIMVQRAGDPDAGSAPQLYCEYGDGGLTSLTPVSTATNPFATFAALPVHIGGSADCGIDGLAGNVNAIVVPKGYYDVYTTLVFAKSA